jgi:hypothetical protein
MCAPLLNSPVLAAFVGALVAGLFGAGAVWLGLRRFRSEKWWERKATAYASVIEALHVLEDVEDEEIDAIEKAVQLPMERLEKLRQKSIAAREETRKYANLSGFVVTDETAKILDEMTRALEIPQRSTQSNHDYLERRWAAVTGALAAVKIEARRDLRT